jgi:hypothetical protein
MHGCEALQVFVPEEERVGIGCCFRSQIRHRVAIEPDSNVTVHQPRGGLEVDA